MKRLGKYQWGIIGAFVGAIAGFIYWKEVGCVTGTCPIKSNWQVMVPYSAVMGYLGADFLKEIKKQFVK